MACKCIFLISTLVCLLLSFNSGSAQKNDTGEKAEGGLTEVDEKEAAAINITDKPSVKKLPYTWKIIPNDTLLISNDSVYIDCVAQANGKSGEPPAYEWTTGNGETVPANNNASSEGLNIWSFENGTLVIKNFSKDLSGEYSCSVKSYLKKTISIKLGKPVTLGKLPTKAERFIGCNLTIQCIASGDGTLEGSWLYGEEEKEILSGGSRIVRHFKENNTYHLFLDIVGATAEDSDNYTCEITSQFDPSSEKKKISVNFIENPQNESCSENKIVASSPFATVTKIESKDNLAIVYIIPLVVILALVLIGVIVAIAFIIRRRRLKQNAVFSGVKYRRTEGNEDGVHA